jgi:hypothetical protein
LPDIPRRWIILLCLFLGRTALGVQFQSLVSVGDQVAGELSLSYQPVEKGGYGRISSFGEP